MLLLRIVFLPEILIQLKYDCLPVIEGYMWIIYIKKLSKYLFTLEVKTLKTRKMRYKILAQGLFCMNFASCLHVIFFEQLKGFYWSITTNPFHLCSSIKVKKPWPNSQTSYPLIVWASLGSTYFSTLFVSSWHCLKPSFFKLAKTATLVLISQSYYPLHLRS